MYMYNYNNTSTCTCTIIIMIHDLHVHNYSIHVHVYMYKFSPFKVYLHLKYTHDTCTSLSQVFDKYTLYINLLKYMYLTPCSLLFPCTPSPLLQTPGENIIVHSNYV